MNKKIASEIAIGVIILLAIIIGGIFWLQNKNQTPAAAPVVTQRVPVAQTPADQPVATQPTTQPAVADETANWQIYTDKTNGVEFKYPSNYKVKKPASDVIEVNIPQKKEYLQIQNFNNSQPLPKEQYGPFGASPVGDVMIGGKDAIKYHTDKPTGDIAGDLENIPYTDYVIVLNANSYTEISYFGNIDTSMSFEKILSTFKFTK